MASKAIPQFDIPERRGKVAIFNGSYLSDVQHYISVWHSQRIVIVASATLYKDHDYVQALERQLGDRIVGKIIGVRPHSPYNDVMRIAHTLQDQDADCLISIGSSSYSDASKIASKLANTLPPEFTVDDMEGLIEANRGHGITKPANVKVILIPTSLSAAEWNGTGSCTNASGKKQHFGIGDHRTGAADLILCDPRIAATAPEELWLSSGMRCIDHCIETICNRECSEAAEKDALDGLASMIEGLIEYKLTQDEASERRRKCISEAQEGSRLAITALIVHGNSFGPSHAIGHQLGSVAGIMHGITSCIMLAAVLRYTASSDNPHFSRARKGQAKILETFNDSLKWREDSAADAVTKYVAQLGLPTRLSEAGVTEESQIDRIAEKTLTDVWGGGEAQMTDKGEIKKILESVK